MELTLKPEVETRNDAETESLIPLSFKAIAAGTIPQEHMGRGRPISIPFNIPPTVEVPTNLSSKFEGRRMCMNPASRKPNKIKKEFSRSIR